MSIKYLDDVCKDIKLIDKPLWWHKKGLIYTTTGYGRKIPTDKMVKYNNRLYRVYCCIFSNSGTCYIISKGESLILKYDNY
jgi:hypothetical protein